MDLLEEAWLVGQGPLGERGKLSPLQIADPAWADLATPRPDFRGALYQFLIGLLQTTYAPQDLQEWRDRYANPPSRDELEAAFAPYRHAFLLENDGPAFMQDLALPDEANQLPVLELLIDAGSSSNLYFNKPAADHGLCQHCFAQAVLTLQLNAPAGGRGVRTSLRGGGPLTTLLRPADEQASLWQKLWLNVIPQDALGYPPITSLSDVLPWLAPTRTSDDKGGTDTPPESVHPLQAYWSMPRRIRLDESTVGQGDCAICAAKDVRLIHHYRTRHGGTNYTGNWMHPLTPYHLDAKGEKPPNSCKGRQGGRGYRDWLGLVLGKDDHRPDAAQVVRAFTAKRYRWPARLWCFGFDAPKMKALCWYDSSLPIYTLDQGLQRVFVKRVKEVLDTADSMASTLRAQVKSAWFRRPGDHREITVGRDPISQSFWQATEPTFYRLLDELAVLDFDSDRELAPVYRRWLRDTRQQVLALFDHWVLSGPLEDQDMQRIVKARADLAKELNAGKAMKPLWEIVNRYDREPA
ncbi:type I-E CRISPR-associated protein Cse1/CasA [Stutzerimonas balearica]|uniref:Type I-E CRISPR-associated protein Cse1/CasA n=1 Tax=Stutzerimonas balearica TaxID=74829 RepID=A0A9X7YQN1_9GAMM|nr:type I-E CRISPR-associated protein Cse1/CasA [Stutzerimonas balearica]QQN49911.1 type I-E CRISPR-associated protein Cse1/CasA [Stutzerimonas balearica]